MENQKNINKNELGMNNFSVFFQIIFTLINDNVNNESIGFV